MEWHKQIQADLAEAKSRIAELERERDEARVEVVEPTSAEGAPPEAESSMRSFEKDLEELINRYSIENVVDMPDFLLAGMVCRMIEAIGPSVKKTLDWHGCDSVCHARRVRKGGA